jgi:hypothetical protein
MVFQAVTIEHAEPSEARHRLARARTRLPPGAPLLTLDEAGTVVRREKPGAAGPTPARRLSVLAYHAATRRLAAAEVPLWFLKLKGPAAQLALRNTGVDLEQLGIAPGDLERYGPVLVIDWTRVTGDWLLVWTE